MTDIYTDDLTLNQSEKAYCKRLLAHDWLYPLRSSSVGYSQARKNEQQLFVIANQKKGNYEILFNRIADAKRKVPTDLATVDAVMD